MATPNIVPRADSEGQLGTSSKYWAAAYIDLIYVGAGKIGRDADNLLDFSADNHLTLRLNANNKLVFDGARMYPNSNDGYGLGLASNAFSDLFLASGAVINFNNGNVTLTHSDSKLTLADNDVLAFGTDNDLQVYHNNTDAFINNDTGDLYIKNFANDKDIVFQSDDGSGGTTAYFTVDGGAVRTNFAKELRMLDNAKFKAGTSGDLEIYHDGSNSYLQNSTGDLYIQNHADDKDVILRSDDGSGGQTAYLTLDGSATSMQAAKNIVFADSIRSVFGGGADLAIYHNGTTNNIEAANGNLRLVQSQDDADITFESDDGAGGITTYFYLDGSSATHDGSATTALYTNWPDNSRISLGTSHDLKIYHDGTDTVMQNDTGDLEFQNRQDDGNIVFKSDDGSGGVTEYFRLDGSTTRTVASKDIQLSDNVHAYFGDGFDLQIVHNATDTYLQNLTGHLYIQNHADGKDIILRSDDGSGGLTPYLTLDGSSTSININKDLYAADNVKLRAGNAGDLSMLHNATNSFIQNENGNLSIINYADDKDIIFQSDDGSGGVATYFFLDGSLKYNRFIQNVLFDDNVNLDFGANGNARISTDGTNTTIKNFVGDLNITNVADNRDIIFQSDDGSGGVETYFFLDGSASSGPFTAFPDSSKLAFGDGRDLQIQHDGTNSTIQNNTGNLIIANDTGVTITGASGSTDGKIVIKPVSGGREYQLKNVGSDFRIHDASADVVRIHFDNDGNTGIGTTTPASALHVAGTFQVGVDDTGHDVRFYGAASGRYMEWDESENALKFTDFSRIKIGTGSDLEIYHDGSHSYMQNGTGDLIIKNTTHAGDIIFQTESSGGTLATYFQIDGGITKTTFSKDTKHLDTVKGLFGTNDDLQISHDGNHSYISQAGTGKLYIQQNTDDEDLVLQSDDGSGGVTDYLVLDGSQVTIRMKRQAKWDDNIKATFGNADDLEIYHDGSNSVIHDNGTGHLNVRADNLQLMNAAGNQYHINAISSGSVSIFHNASKKLETTATGIQVSGATGNAAGAGFNTSGTVAIDVGEINGEIITTIKVDLGTGAILSSGTAGDVIGEDDTEGAFLTRITTAVNGIVYRGEMICVEVPTTGDPDINLAANSSATLAEDGAGEGEHVLIDGGTATLAKHYPSFTIPSGGIQNDHLYLTHGGTTAGTYGAGQFIIKLYGAAVVS